MSIQDNFRLAMRRYIYSVSIMSNKDNADNPNAITVSSVTSISMDPPSLLICINKSSRIHNSIELESKFCINLLNNKQEDLSNICSDEDMYDQRFKDENWNLDGIPFLKNAQANIFCKVDKLTSYHTHTIVIGLVEDANYADEISTLTYVDGEYK
ncbi:MAG: flavin reductase family protein [Gammaproteobacteria bacterium]|jgi:flavin reductase (DIM6/NTAB) family NADH-FMN oxidoreductase RutF|tara:strand:- start:49 stop:513 length:465 start_codon:yes stop_codon:yes gene_type:complete